MPIELMLDSQGVLEQIDRHSTDWLFVDGVMIARESIQSINWIEVQSVDLVLPIVSSAYDYDKNTGLVVSVHSCGNCGTLRTIPSPEEPRKNRCKNPNCSGRGGQKIEGRRQMWIEELGKIISVNSCGFCKTTRTIPSPEGPRKDRCKNPKCPGPGK